MRTEDRTNEAVFSRVSSLGPSTSHKLQRGERKSQKGWCNRVHAVPPGTLFSESLCQIIHPLTASQTGSLPLFDPLCESSYTACFLLLRIPTSPSAWVALLMPPQVFLHLIQSSKLKARLFWLPLDLISSPVYMDSFHFPPSPSQGKFFHVGAFISCSLMCIQSPETILFIGVFYQMLNK